MQQLSKGAKLRENTPRILSSIQALLRLEAISATQRDLLVAALKDALASDDCAKLLMSIQAIEYGSSYPEITNELKELATN